MTTKTIDERITTRLAALQQQRAARKDPDDLMLRLREVRTYTNETDTLDAKIAAIYTASAALAEVGTVEADTRWLNFLTTARDKLAAERLAIKSPIRDREIKRRAEDLEWSIKLIDHGFGISRLGIETLAPTRIGELMAAAGYAIKGEALRGPNGWQRSLPEVEARIKTLTRQRTAAQAALDSVLLDDAASATREAEHQTYRETLKTMRLALGSDGTSLVAYTDDDEVLDVSAMTPQQRSAFEWHSRAFAPRETVTS